MAGLTVPRGGGGFWQMGQQHSNAALNAYGGQTPERKQEFTPPGKTAGGGLAAGTGGAVAGYTIGAGIAAESAATATGAVAGGAGTGSAAGPWGAAIGAGVGILAYLLS
jgi:hypothetical protein